MIINIELLKLPLENQIFTLKEFFTFHTNRYCSFFYFSRLNLYLDKNYFLIYLKIMIHYKFSRNI